MSAAIKVGACELGDLRLRIRPAQSHVLRVVPKAQAKTKRKVARDFMTKIERLVARQWRTVGPRFSDEDRGELVCLVLLRISEKFTADDIAENTGRVINYAKRVAAGAVADLVSDKRRYAKDDGIAPGLGSLTSGPREVSYADDIAADAADEDVVPEGLPLAGNSAPSSSCHELSEANDYPTEDELIHAIDERRTLERVRATLALLKNRQHRDPHPAPEVDSTDMGTRFRSVS